MKSETLNVFKEYEKLSDKVIRKKKFEIACKLSNAIQESDSAVKGI